MTNTLTKGATVITPDVVKPYNYARPAKTVVHILPSVQADSYTIAPAGKRQGTLELVFALRTKAQDAETALAIAGVWAYVDTYNTYMDMNLIVTGDINPAQQDSLARWVLSLPFKEV